MINERMPI